MSCEMGKRKDSSVRRSKMCGQMCQDIFNQVDCDLHHDGILLAGLFGNFSDINIYANHICANIDHILVELHRIRTGGIEITMVLERFACSKLAILLIGSTFSCLHLVLVVMIVRVHELQEADVCSFGLELIIQDHLQFLASLQTLHRCGCCNVVV